MEFKHPFKILLLLISSLLFNPQLTAEEMEETTDEENGLTTFFAISAVLGITETNLVDQNFQRINTTNSYLESNVEIQLRWNGFFYENPGRSQENVDGLFSGDAIGYNFYNSEHWAWDLYGVHAFGKGERVFQSDEERLILRKDSNYRVGVRATGYYSDYLAQIIATPISLGSDIDGFTASMSLRRTWLVKNWNFYGTIGINYQSADIVDYYWGVTEQESQLIKQVLGNPDAPFDPYEAKGGFFGVGELGFEYPLSENLVFGGFVTTVARADSVIDSPVTFDGRTVSTAGLSMTYVF